MIRIGLPVKKLDMGKAGLGRGKTNIKKGIMNLTKEHAEFKKIISENVVKTAINEWFASEKIQRINSVQANAIKKILSNPVNREIALRRIRISLYKTNPTLKKTRALIAEEILNKILEISEKGFVPVRVLDLIKLRIERAKIRPARQKQAVA